MNTIKIFADVKSQVQKAVEPIPRNELNVQNILNWVYAMAGLVAVIYIIYGAISYVMSEGNPGKITKARQTLTFAFIGLTIILIATAITNFVFVTINNAGLIMAGGK